MKALVLFSGGLDSTTSLALAIDKSGYDILPCGHNVTYAGYIDSDACMLCDKLAMS